MAVHVFFFVTIFECFVGQKSTESGECSEKFSDESHPYHGIFVTSSDLPVRSIRLDFLIICPLVALV